MPKLPTQRWTVLLERLSRRFRSSGISAESKACAFDNVMEVARDIAKHNPRALRDLIRALLLPLQSQHLIAVAEKGAHAAPSEIDADTFFFDASALVSFYDYWVQPTPEYRIDLSRDIVLTTPWHRGRYTSALWSIGAQKGFDAWTQDDNHRLSVLLPWGITFVHGGNHSIAAGILAGEGTLLAEEVLDATSLMDLVSCDGQHYRSKSTGKAIARVQDHRRAAVFEIGRLILERE